MVQPSEQSAKGKGKASARPAKGKRKQGGKGLAATLAGGEDRKADLQLALAEKAWGYKIKGYSPREIGDAIADEFGIEGPIHHKTIYRWLDAGRELITRKIGLHREEHIATVLPRTEDQLRYWLPKANGKNRFAIARMEKIDGNLIEVIDEAVFKEEAIAANIVLKTLEQQRKVLGIGLANSGDDTDTKAASLTQINIVLQQAVVNLLNQQPDKPALVIEAGDAAFEQL